MSVINNVLKGLEARESQFTPIEIFTTERSSAPVRRYRPVLYSGLVLLVLVCAATIYLFQREITVLLSAVATTPAEVAAVAEVAPDVAVVTEPSPASATIAAIAPVLANEVGGNQIRGLQIRETETEMRLEFELSERVAAYLKERSENSFEFHLRATDSQIQAPVMRDNPWIQSLSIRQAGSGVDISFVTAMDILVETRQYQSDGESIWVINLRQSRSLATAAPVEPAPPAAAATITPPPAESASEQDKSNSVDKVPPSGASVKLEIKSTNPSSASGDQLDYAVELMNSRRPQDAETLLLGLLDGPADYQARQHLLALYNRQQSPGRLRPLLLASLKAYPMDPLFVTEYARLLFAGGAYQEVTQMLAPEALLDVNQRALLAASYQRLDQHEQAIQHYRQALQLDADNARNWVGIAISLEQEAAFVEALDSYQQAARLGGLNARLQAFVERRSNKLRQVIN